MRGTASALLLTVLAAAILHAATAQECGEPPQLIFKRPADPAGQRSYITSPGQPLHFALNVPLPPVILQVISAEGIGFDFSYDGLQIVATAEPSLRLGGSSVDVNRGEAVFDALTIEQLPQSGAPELVFTLKTHDGTILALRTAGVVSHTQAELADPSSLRFANNGYFTRPNRGRQIPVAPAVLPTVLLEVVNAIGYPIVMQDVTIDVTASDGATVSPAQFTTTEINGLAIQATSTQRPVLTFTASATLSDGSPWTATVVTGALIPVTAVLRNRFMLFDESRSFIKTENEGNTAVLGVPLPPVVINLYTSGMERDTSNTGLIITATTPQGTLSGAEALVVRGVATFSELVFVGVAPRSAVITFTAGTQGGTAVAGSTLLSGAMVVSITAVKARHLSFASTSAIQATTPAWFSQTNQEFSVGTIIVQVRDSAYQLDSTANDIDLTLEVTPSGFVIAKDPTKMEATVSNGIAVFSGLEFTLASSPFQFVVTDPASGGGSNGRASLTSAEVTVAANPLTANARQVLETAQRLLGECRLPTSTVCVFTLRFASEYGTFSSHVFEEDQQLFTTVGGQIPTIVVVLRDQFGVATSFPDAVAPALVAYTADDPDAETLLVTEGGANRGLWQNGRYYFSCLQFTAVPTGLVRIQFMPIDERTSSQAIRLEGITKGRPLSTGFVTVTEAVQQNFGLRFAPAQSAIAYPGQPSSAVLNVALPPITIEIVDSLGNFDGSDSSIVIVASTSSGSLDPAGARERVKDGRATFHGLKFASVADEPRLTFTAYQTDKPVAGRSIRTGFFTVTSLPIEEYAPGFLAEESVNNMVGYEFKPLIFQTAAEATVRASIGIYDSAHQRATSLTSTIFISPSSEEANLDAAELKSIEPRTACACANFTNRITGFKDGYDAGTPIFIKYTISDASGLLRDKAVVVGPISVAALQQTSQSCAANLIAPTVVGEFRLSVAAFNARDVTGELASFMGIERSRVTILPGTVTRITRVDHLTLASWTGTKASIVFGDPQPSSTNQKTSAQLAADFVALRPRCDVRSLALEAAYYREDDRSCNPDEFRASLERARQCVAAGVLGTCQCYSQGVVAEWGQACAEDAAVESDFSVICADLADCAEAEIQGICETILAAQETSFVWLWALLGSLGGVAIIVIILRQRGFLQGRSKTSLKGGQGGGQQAAAD